MYLDVKDYDSTGYMHCVQIGMNYCDSDDRRTAFTTAVVIRQRLAD